MVHYSANTSQLLSLFKKRARASSARGGSGILTSGECCVLRIIKKSGSISLAASMLLAKELQKGYFLHLVIWPFPGRRNV